MSGAPSSPEGAKLTLLRDGQVVGERRFGPLHVPCEEARAAIGLAIAVAIDNTLLRDLGAEPPPAPAPPLPAPLPPEPPAPPPVPPPPPLGLGMSLDLTGEVGPLPSLVAGVSPALELMPHRMFEIRLGGLFTTPSTFPVGTGTVSAEIFAGRIDGCAAFQLGPRAEGARLAALRLHLCGGVLAGVVHTGVVSGLTPSPSPTSPWVSAALRFDGRVALNPRFGLEVSVDAFAPITRTEVEVTDASGAVADTHPLAPVGVAVGFGPHFIFR